MFFFFFFSEKRVVIYLCLPFQEPIWFEYYGPIRQRDAINAINAAISDRLHEIGSIEPIPVKKVITPHIKVPICLNTPFIAEQNNSTVTFQFSTSSIGRITLQTEDSSESYEYGIGFDLIQKFSKPNNSKWSLKFDFSSINGVTCRIYTLLLSNSTDIIILDDKIIINGVISTISKVYKQDENINEGFNEGLCLICCTEKATVVTFPCRHCCMCRECSERSSEITSRCPVCRSLVS